MSEGLRTTERTDADTITFGERGMPKHTVTLTDIAKFVNLERRLLCIYLFDWNIQIWFGSAAST